MFKIVFVAHTVLDLLAFKFNQMVYLLTKGNEFSYFLNLNRI